MRIIKLARIRAYGKQFPDAEVSLLSFLRVAKAARWNNIHEVRRTYPHADAVRVASGRTVTVFNVRKNVYRLIVAIHYNKGVLYVLGFMRHAEYDRGNWKEKL